MVTVVKLGGSLIEDRAARRRALSAVAARCGAGHRMVLVHGGGRQVDALLAERGIPRRVHQGLRVTDDRTLETVVAVLAGLVNKTLVAELSRHGVRAAGVCGADGGTLRARRRAPVDGVDLGHVGAVTGCDTTMLAALMSAGLLPVVASVAIGPAGTLLNVNADAAAVAVARGLDAARLVFLTDVEGLLDGDGRLVDRIDAPGARRLLATGAVGGGMRPKLAACLEAVASGVSEVRIAGPARQRSALIRGVGGTIIAA